ncbi:Hypothetical protein FBFL15_2093 [Flavobacterium branchiophilum FL-15]|uniref:Uncharacterized protein n=1 Tax=Flavobacterium branchiophilum (strain FL-15) TaxID=1034807 RepID=G2Z2F8_FLABF|nr:Hypothetical protein FBFL15_2093 [Flavobacterium branchiophilum FL-15]
MVEVYKIIRGVQTILTIWDGANFSKAFEKVKIENRCNQTRAL